MPDPKKIGFKRDEDERFVGIDLDVDDSRRDRDVAFEVSPPARTNSYAPPGIEGPLARLALTAPKSLHETDVRIGFAAVASRSSS